MKCRCCQNWQISQVSSQEYRSDRLYLPEEILKIALSDKNNIGVAYTYNEPGIWFEYMLAIARLVHREGLKNVMVSNGFISEEPLRELLLFLDAFNIDLKGFSETFYHRFTGASLAPVLHSLKQIRNAGKHMEITCLVIPGQNDDPGEFTEMIDWIEGELGNQTILHLSRYHPAYKLGIEPTPSEDLEILLDIARKKLFYVYAGNIQLKDYQDTKCSKCRNIVIRRTGYYVDKIALTGSGSCKHCGNQVILC
jgi:pyruvate formate lyase activating enzyme